MMHKRASQKRSQKRRCHKSCESWISIKKWGRISDGFSDGLRCVAWESDGKLGPLGHFDLEKKGKIAIKEECWKHYYQL